MRPPQKSSQSIQRLRYCLYVRRHLHYTTRRARLILRGLLRASQIARGSSKPCTLLDEKEGGYWECIRQIGQGEMEQQDARRLLEAYKVSSFLRSFLVSLDLTVSRSYGHMQ